MSRRQRGRQGFPHIPRSVAVCQQTLTFARDLIASPDTWTPMPSAVDRNGITVHPYSQHAVRFGAVGAIDRAGMELGESTDAAHRTAERSARLMYGQSLGRVNTTRGHRLALNVINDALWEAQAA